MINDTMSSQKSQNDFFATLYYYTTFRHDVSLNDLNATEVFPATSIRQIRNGVCKKNIDNDIFVLQGKIEVHT